MRPKVVIIQTRSERILVGVLVGSVLFVGGLIGLAFLLHVLTFGVL